MNRATFHDQQVVGLLHLGFVMLLGLAWYYQTLRIKVALGNVKTQFFWLPEQQSMRLDHTVLCHLLLRRFIYLSYTPTSIYIPQNIFWLLNSKKLECSPATDFFSDFFRPSMQIFPRKAALFALQILVCPFPSWFFCIDFCPWHHQVLRNDCQLFNES